MMTLWFLLLLLALVDAGSVLISHPMYAPSHVLALRQLAKSLVQKGHKVTIIRWTDIHMYPPCYEPGIKEFILAVNNSNGLVPHMTHEGRAKLVPPRKMMWSVGTSWTALPFEMFATVGAHCWTMFQDQQLLDILRQEPFDAAIVDLVTNECGLALAHHLGLPTIGYWAFTFVGGEPQYTTAFNSPASTPVVLSHYTDVMSFSQRAFNFFLDFLSHVVMRIEFFFTGYYISKYIPNTPSPDVLLANLSGALINSHPVIEYPRLLPPSFLEVGGLQILDSKPLPKDLELFLASSGTAGTILFALGFAFDTTVVPHSVFSNLLRAFGRLQQNVLMKFDGKLNNLTIPENVKVVKWLPQQDVLAHPKTVLFFTHCGMHGVMEAIHYAVPMVGMPIFADQMDVLVRIEHKGIGLGVQKYASQDQFYQTITQVINNQSYHDNIRRLSKILRDDREHPMDRAVWLVEHVMKTGGAEHLKMSSRHLSLLQYFGVDVYCSVLLGFYILLKHVVPLLLALFLKLIFCIAKLSKRKRE